MFKYGSFRHFVIKTISGALLFVFGIVYLLSIYSYNKNDPALFGTKDTNFNAENFEINNQLGLFGSYLSQASTDLFGNLSYLIVFFFLFEGIKLFLSVDKRFKVLRFVSIIFAIVFINIFLHAYGAEIIYIGELSTQLGSIIFQLLNKNIDNEILLYLAYFFILLIGFLLLIFSYSIRYNFFLKTFQIIALFKKLKYFSFLLRLFKFKKQARVTQTSYYKSEPTIEKKSFFSNKQKVNKQDNKYKQLEINQFKFSLPTSELLIKSNSKNFISKELDKLNLEAAKKLEQTLSEYGVEGKVVGFKSGPIVTLFEFIPSAGIKSSKVIGLSDDLARAMSSFSARISSQPGKTSLGIEIPNSKREGVLFGDLIEDGQYKNKNESITLALGKDISGEKIYTDLEKMPHLLIAGTTGSGKSVGINTMILSILYKFKPNECKLILIDPKMLELSIYEDIPHLLTPVVTDPKKAVYALKWVVREMENRYKLMSSVNVKNIGSYNTKVLRTITSGRKLFREVQTGVDSDTRMPIIEKKEITLEKMPFIVVVIDEMADLMMVAGKEVESLVQRLAQMARASGIHLITATQRPSVDVITGTIKANFPSRISYKVASKFDSRTILNEMGAEQLLGSGDMLLLENGGNIKRLHGGYVSEGEVERVVNSIKKQATFDYKKEISLQDADGTNGAINGDLISNNNDELYNKAVDIVVKQQKVSTSFIQRYLQIGYNRAARIVEKMEEDGIITEASNAGKRHVLKKE